MPGVKSVTITVEYLDGTTEVATVRHPREITISNSTDRGLWREEVPHRTAPLYSIDLAVKDALEVDWRAVPAGGAPAPVRAPIYPLTDVQDKRGPDPAPARRKRWKGDNASPETAEAILAYMRRTATRGQLTASYRDIAAALDLGVTTTDCGIARLLKSGEVKVLRPGTSRRYPTCYEVKPASHV